MLRKNIAPNLKQNSTMGIVYSLVCEGVATRHEIVKRSKLRSGQVKSALYNLSFVGLLELEKTKEGSRYSRKGDLKLCSDCLKGINSIFNHKALP